MPNAGSPYPADVGPSTRATVDALVAGLERLIDVVFTPLADVVARLDTTGQVKVLYLDSDSPPGDQCWALTDALRVLALGETTAARVVPAQRVYLVRD